MPSFEGIKHRSYGWTHERRERAQAPGRSLRSPARASPWFPKWELRAIENWLADVESAVWNDGARLELLAKLIDDYERERFAFRKPDPIDAILFRMEEQGLRQADIAAIGGGKNRASEILSRKRPLTLAMVRALHEKLGIPSELLIREPSAEYRVRRRGGGRDDEPPGNWRQTSKLGSDPDHLALRPDR